VLEAAELELSPARLSRAYCSLGFKLQLALAAETLGIGLGAVGGKVAKGLNLLAFLVRVGQPDYAVIVLAALCCE
jgi:hypothetical protein